jgi:pyridoxine 5'-phosphate synthase PdxJ
MDSLERITFDACHGLTNAGVARLARLPRLRELRVSGKGVTTDVVEAFSPQISVLYAP